MKRERAMATFVKVGQARIRCECRGDGEPILFVSGLGNGWRCWEQQFLALEDQFRCLSYDPRDVGESDLASSPYSTSDLATDAVGVLDALGVRQAHVVGWSMGGAVAQEIAIAWPERVKRLALIATYADGDARGAANLRGWALLRRRLTRDEYLRVTAPWVYSPAEYEQPMLVQSAIELALAAPEQPQAAFERQVEATVLHHAGGRLSHITAPTLLVFGADDALTPLHFAQTLHEEISRSELIVLDGAGHALLRTRTVEVNQALQHFLHGGSRGP